MDRNPNTDRGTTQPSKGKNLFTTANTLSKLAQFTFENNENQCYSDEFCNAVNNAFLDLKAILSGADVDDLQVWVAETTDSIQFLVAKLLRCCGSLARYSNVKLTAESLEFLLKQIRGQGRITSPLAKMSFQGLNMVLQADKVDNHDGLFRARLLGSLAEDLSKIPKVDDKTIYYFLALLASLSESKLLQGQLELTYLSALLRKIPTNPGVIYKNLTMPIYFLGILAQNKHLVGKIDAIDLVALLRYPYQPGLPRISFINLSANMICGISELIMSELLSNAHFLGSYIDQILVKYSGNPVAYLNAKLCLMGIQSLWPYYECDIKHIRLLLAVAVDKTDLNEEQIDSTINNFITFKKHHVVLNQSFLALIGKISHPISPNLWQKLRMSADKLQGVATWARDLKTIIGMDVKTNNNNNNNNINFDNLDRSAWTPPPPPKKYKVEDDEEANEQTEKFLQSLVPSITVTNLRNQRVEPSETATIAINRVPPIALVPPAAELAPAYQVVTPVVAANGPSNAIYKAIASNKQQELMHILQLSLDLPQSRNHNPTYKSTPSFFKTDKNNSHQSPRIWHNHETEQLVINFFQEIPENDLRQLIQGAKPEYFNLLLRALSPSKRYQLAINKKFKPLMMYLPIDELSPMVDSFIERGLYIDHNALSQLIWDLRARRNLEQGNKVQIISELEQQLFRKCLSFHESSKHHIVVADLKEFKKLLDKPNQQSGSDYEDIDEDDYDITATRYGKK